jgi:hypothetical protein
MHHEARSSRVAGEFLGPSLREDWFADDVVVDFPALRPMVERMRASFFGGAEPDEDPPRAEVCLTPAQARAGSRVPVDVHVRRVCRACGGRGEIWNDPCVRCGGQGSGVAHHTVEVDVPSGVCDGARLAFSLEAPHVPATRVHLRVLVA